MKKKPWDTKPHERDRRTPAQKIADLEERLEDLLHTNETLRAVADHYKGEAREYLENHQRYLALREKELVVMDGEAKYLKLEDLDAYCDKEVSRILPNIGAWVKAFQGVSGYNPTKMLVPQHMIEQSKKLLDAQFDNAYKQWLHRK